MDYSHSQQEVSDLENGYDLLKPSNKEVLSGSRTLQNVSSSIMLIIALLSEYVVGTIEAASDSWGISVSFISIILLPIVGNAAEHAGSIIFAFKNKLDISLGVALGSATQISMFVVPLCVIVGWIMHVHMDLDFSLLETGSLAFTIIITAFTLQDGTSHYMKGVVLFLCYIVISACFWVHKIPQTPTESTQVATRNVAAIFGVTGLVGRELLRRLLSESKWKVYGIARRFESFPTQNLNYHFISCDLLNAQETQKKLSIVQDTGMKHYVSLQQTHNLKQEVCFHEEDCPRASEGYNFYYVLEDLIKERLAGKVAWSVIRPGLLMGSSNRTLYNVMGCLCVYGAICKYLNLPFVFGGTREVWEEVCMDGSDARLVAEQHIWAATNDEISSTEGQAFNAINGPCFTWKKIWPVLGKKFEVEVPQDMFLSDFRFATAMSDNKKVWQEIVATEGLVETEMEDLANWEFLDVLFRCPVKLLGSRKKTDQLGFTMRSNTMESILYWIDSMRNDKLIP
ncbi:hypothetical protein GH714_035094 [Hevea brasiliensis]|uniref:NAD(P)-binding domain-containing protein n=1 Tax=Hevea brasiliensis TaxID=3981 RepID=A0A6A6MK97_HEVBR|nr:hypothetical protein GH714_035094 [Hevea brasiliensis]